MNEQNFTNHAQIVPFFHRGMAALCLVCLVLASVNLVYGINLGSVLLLLMAITFLFSFWFIRSFPLKAQDRAIRAEENLRHYVLTGKLLDKNLKMGQIVALRFADDAEFVALAAKGAAANMSNKEIKQAIQHWKADHNRVEFYPMPNKKGRSSGLFCCYMLWLSGQFQ